MRTIVAEPFVIATNYRSCDKEWQTSDGPYFSEDSIELLFYLRWFLYIRPHE
jgi:hypothetical protein